MGTYFEVLAAVKFSTFMAKKISRKPTRISNISNEQISRIYKRKKLYTI